MQAYPTKFSAGYQKHKQVIIIAAATTKTKIITTQESEKTSLRTTRKK
jgi:hypothetical protein